MGLKEMLGLSPPTEKNDPYGSHKRMDDTMAAVASAWEKIHTKEDGTWIEPMNAQGVQVARPATVTEIAMRQQAMYEKLYGQNVKFVGPDITSGQAFTITSTSDPDTDDLWVLRMENLDHPAGKASLQELEELWRTRWGSSWVKRGEITDTFYNIAAVRLAEAQKLEMHELSDGTRVYRLK